MNECSFCHRRVGESDADHLTRYAQAMPESRKAEVLEHIRTAFGETPGRPVRLLMPGPGDLAICDICVERYSDAVQRELATRA